VKIIYNWTDEYSEYLETVKQLSKETKNRFFMASPYIGKDADEILGSIKAADKRCVIDLSNSSVGSGATNPWTVEKLQKIAEIKKLATLHAKIFVFDKKAVIGSANLSWNAFLSRIEAGVIIEDDKSIETVAALFERIWNEAEEISDLDISEMKNYWKKTAANKHRPRFPENSSITPGHFSKSKKEIEKIFLKNKPNSSIFQERELSFSIAHELAQKLKKQDLSENEMETLLTRINENTAAVSPIGRINIDRILTNDLKRLNAVFRRLLDEGEDLDARIDAVLTSDNKPRGVSIGVVSSILFAYNFNKYCIYNKPVVGGLSKVFTGAKEVKTGEDYREFNLLARKVKSEFNISPIELDNVLFNKNKTA
jgi:hypothetical protein